MHKITFLIIVICLLAAFGGKPVSASCADQVTHNVRATNATTTVALYGAWWYAVEATPAQTSTDFGPNQAIYLNFTQIVSGTVYIYDYPSSAGGQLCQVIEWKTPKGQVFLPAVEG